MSVTKQTEVAAQDAPSSPSLKRIPKRDDLHASFHSDEPIVVPEYKHLIATHTEPNTSCLSQASQQVSFAGFRNLMVLVIGRLIVRDSRAI